MTSRRSAAVVVLTVAALVALAPAPASAKPHPEQAWTAHRASAAQVTLDGIRVRLRPGTQQVVTVNHSTGYRARVSFWRLTDTGWEARFASADGRIGYGGLVVGHRRKQGTGTTPLGTYALPWAFGFQQRRNSWRLRYRAVERGDFWVQDNASRHYNRYRNQAQGGFRWWLPASNPNSSERLTDFRRQYDLSIVMDYNPGQVPHRGSGIFLHMNGRGATAGCVSAPRQFIQRTLTALDPDLAPVIAVGR